MAEYIPETHSFSEAKAASVETLDSITGLLKKAINGNIVTIDGKKKYDGYIDKENNIFALEKDIKEINYWVEQMPEPEPGEEEGSPRTVAENFKKNIETVRDTLDSASKMNKAYIEMANNGAPFVEFKSVESPDPAWNPNTDDMPYIELWGQTYSGGLATLKDLNGTVSLLGQYGNIDVEGESEFERNKCRFNVILAVKNSSGNYITKPVYEGSGTYVGNTIYLVVRGESVKDGDNKSIDPKYYNFVMKDKTVKIVKIGNRLMAHVGFDFVFPVGLSRDKYLEYPEKYFTLSKTLPPYELSDIDTSDIDKYFKENGFWLYVVDNRNEFE